MTEFDQASADDDPAKTRLGRTNVREGDHLLPIITYLDKGLLTS